MAFVISTHRLRLFLNRLRERLWVKPLAIAMFSIAAAFASKLSDGTGMGKWVPRVEVDSIEALLAIMASSMLVIATFAVASMVSAYSSASNVATPRAFTLVVSDDTSQNALSTFIGAFIFSIVSLTALKNSYYQAAGQFCLFALTAIVFGVVIVTFVRWVDRVARLGRLTATVDKVEQAAAAALLRRRHAPTLGGAECDGQAGGQSVFASAVGYVQHIDMEQLQRWANGVDAQLSIAALPGTFVAPGRPLALIWGNNAGWSEQDCEQIRDAFQVGDDRIFDDDPRFGLVVLSEIAGRALSPAVNDPGTAIDVIGTLVRLLVDWQKPAAVVDVGPLHPRVRVPALSIEDVFDDAFTAIARDGAGVVEVAVRLQKALQTLAQLGDPNMHRAAERHALMALARAERAMTLPADFMIVRQAADWRSPVG